MKWREIKPTSADYKDKRVSHRHNDTIFIAAPTSKLVPFQDSSFWGIVGQPVDAMPLEVAILHSKLNTGPWGGIRMIISQKETFQRVPSWVKVTTTTKTTAFAAEAE